MEKLQDEGLTPDVSWLTRKRSFGQPGKSFLQMPGVHETTFLSEHILETFPSTSSYSRK